MRFSVITPAHNAVATIGDAIGSIQRQTATDWEHLVVDDGSVDGTARLTEELAQADPRIRLVKLTENSGASTARNLAMEAARGELLIFLDADDEAHPRRLELQHRALSERADLAALGSAVELFGDAEGTINPALDATEVGVRTLFGPEFIMSSVAMRRSVQRDAQLWFAPGHDTAEDWEFFSQLMRSARMGNLAEVLARYRRSRTQATANLVDRPDDRAARLRCEQLAWLGVAPAELDIEAHIAVSPCFWPVRKDVPAEAFGLERITRWLDKLGSANDRSRRYPPPHFREIIRHILGDYRATATPTTSRSGQFNPK